MTQKEFIDYIANKYDRLTLSRPEAAHEADLSVNGIINFTKDGQIRAFKAGNRIKYLAADLATFMGYK